MKAWQFFLYNMKVIYTRRNVQPNFPISTHSFQLFLGFQTSSPNAISFGRFRRQVGDDRRGSGEERTYDLEISFPTKDTDEVINNEGRRQKLTDLFEKLLFENNKLDVSDQLFNTQINDESISVGQAFTCDEGYVVRDNQCGK